MRGGGKDFGLVGVIGDEEGLSGGARGEIGLVFADAGATVGFRALDELRLGVGHVVVGSLPCVENGSLQEVKVT